MQKLISTAAIAALCLCLPATAQRMGSSNRKAPTLTESIEFVDGATLTLKYQSVTWAEGRTMEMLMDKEGGERFREMVNDRAAKSPLGSLVVSAGFEIGGKKVAKGDYSVYFTIDDDTNWHLVFASKADDSMTMKWKLELADTDKHRSRLALDVSAGDEDDTGTIGIAFGTKSCSVTFAPQESDDENDGE